MLAPVDTAARRLAGGKNRVYYYNYQHRGEISDPNLYGISEVRTDLSFEKQLDRKVSSNLVSLAFDV